MYEEDNIIEISKRKTATTTLNALQQPMQRRPLNSAFSTTTVHKEPEKMLDGIDTQVEA